MGGAVYRWLDTLGDWLLPPQCTLCRRAGERRGRDLCAACEADLPRLDPAVVAAAWPGTAGSASARCLAPFPYAFPLDQLVPALKYRAALAHARLLGTLLAEAALRAGLEHGVDLLVPLPLHTTRLVERGYNQSLELARCAGRVVRVAVDPRALWRTRATAPQVGLARTARRENVRGAFGASRVRVAGRRVVVVDDVVTTGSTLATATAALLEAGAARVDAWCVARALDPPAGPQENR